MITSIISLILSIPKFLELAERFVVWMGEMITIIRKKQLLKELEKATDVSKKTKNTSRLDSLFDPRKK